MGLYSRTMINFWTRLAVGIIGQSGDNTRKLSQRQFQW